ncbi:hypothetical protein BLNAU_24716 [Blattamonas nauphoetae]|uniref:Uncharacterized protein n=1 Tax=Blattamonas nauphoetae TaxID=2049346 RepID=A0ABQ9WLN8_9EUKA|nr:hypothetical protein BLNAU_24716 [Blattamonas nauphoetae]
MLSIRTPRSTTQLSLQSIHTICGGAYETSPSPSRNPIRRDGRSHDVFGPTSTAPTSLVSSCVPTIENAGDFDGVDRGGSEHRRVGTKITARLPPPFHRSRTAAQTVTPACVLAE